MIVSCPASAASARRDLERRERVAGVALGAVDEVLERVGVDLEAVVAETAFTVRRARARAACATPDVVERPRAGTACERESSGPVSEKNGFSVVAPTRTSRPSSTCGQQHVLLRAVEAVHLVEEEDRALAALAEPGPRPLDDLAHVLHARGHGRERLERLARWRRRRAGRWWSCRCPAVPRARPTASRSDSIRTRSGLPGASSCVLADDLVERPGPEPGGQRGPARAAAPRPRH